MTTNAQAMVMASFAADALSLGAHWIYDTDLIEQKIGRVETYREPIAPTYHSTKKAGELTHYGDQTLWLLESMAEPAGFDLNRFAERWKTSLDTYDGYFDGATKQTLKNLAAGAAPAEAGSNSSDLAGAARIAPLVYFYREDFNGLVASARAQTAFTHNQSQVVDSAAIFARVALDALAGQSPRKALSDIRSQQASDAPIARWLSQGLASTDLGTRQAIFDLGQMCEIEAAFPATVHLIAKYEDNLSGALIENVMAGGDSAGRGLLVGLILGAYQGIAAIPAPWLDELKARDHIMGIFEKLDADLR